VQYGAGGEPCQDTFAIQDRPRGAEGADASNEDLGIQSAEVEDRRHIPVFETVDALEVVTGVWFGRDYLDGGVALSKASPDTHRRPPGAKPADKCIDVRLGA
jgi:hypothetical protein